MPRTQTRRNAFNAILLGMAAMLLWACSDLPVSTGPTPTTVALQATRTPRPTRVAPTPTEELFIEDPTETPEEEPAATPTPRKSLGGGGSGPTATEEAPRSTRTPRTTPTAVAGEATPIATLMPSADRLAIFEQVWETVADNYLYEDFHGADWDALKEEYEPKVRAATSGDEFYATVDDMVSELGDDHSRFISPWDADEEDDLMSGNTSYVGVGIFSKHNETEIQVVYVFPGSPAEEGGIQRRDVITAVDGGPITPADEDLSRIRGPEGSKVTLTVRSPGEEPRDVELVRRPINGAVLPSARWLEADPSVGYLVIPSFDPEDMDEQVADELATLVEGDEPLAGIVVDLRGNGGGLIDTMQRIVGQFMTGEAGKYASRGREHMMVPPRGTMYQQLKDIPLVVLVDEG
ncbi:MAG TPA: S41 family peptidase, partial [Chloroflexia bacterium]|nr:S41 family peptidase [Chloroflexia bacterium]